MYFIDLLKQISFNMLTHKLRTCAALFGIVWGTITVILLLALGDGFYAASTKDLAFLNNGTIFGWSGMTSKSYAGMPSGQLIHLQMKDLLDVVQDVPGIQSFSPVYTSQGKLQYLEKQSNASIQGVAAGYDVTQQWILPKGSRFINTIDIEKNQRVVFLDASLKSALFGKKDAVGKQLSIQGIPFTVIGVTDPDQEGAIRFMRENNAYIPYTTYLAIHGQQDIRFLFLTPQFPDATARIKHNLRNILALKFHYDPNDEEAFNIPDLEKTQVFFTWFFRVIEFFLLFCGVLTLSVGGLGTANMMFLIVAERTREIGLRMALGAKHSDIMRQFMLETVFLVALGGVLGTLISLCILAILNHMHLPTWLGNPHISWGTAILTVLALAFIGISAGYFPARRAAMMEPVKALGF